MDSRWSVEYWKHFKYISQFYDFDLIIVMSGWIQENNIGMHENWSRNKPPGSTACLSMTVAPQSSTQCQVNVQIGK